MTFSRHLARAALVVVGFTLLVLMGAEPLPGLVRDWCPTVVGNQVVDLCRPEPQPVQLEIRETVPACSPEQLALLAPGFQPSNCLAPAPGVETRQ